jgi:hypothetical protein
MITKPRKLSASDPQVAAFVDWIVANENDVWLYYLAHMGLNSHLAKHMKSSPFMRGTRLDDKILQLIHRFDSSIDSVDVSTFRRAVQLHVRENKLIARAYKDFKEP